MKSPNRGQDNRSLLNYSGKGDADRTTDVVAYRRNFDGIDFSQVSRKEIQLPTQLELFPLFFPPKPGENV